MLYVFDLDGTLLSLPPGSFDEFHNFNQTAFRANQHLAEPIAPMVEMAKALINSEHHVIILTARPEDMRDVTQAKLNEMGLGKAALMMNNTGQSLPYKVDVLNTLKHSNIALVFEDRQEIVDAMLAAGFNAFLVPPRVRG